MADIDTVVESIGGKVTIEKEIDETPTQVEVPHLRGWSLSKKCEANKYSSTDTAGWTGKMMGPLDWSGSLTVYLNDESEDTDYLLDDLIQIGEGYFAEFFYGDATIDFWVGEIKITGIDLEMDHETGKPVAATVNFEGHGEQTMDTPT